MNREELEDWLRARFNKPDHTHKKGGLYTWTIVCLDCLLDLIECENTKAVNVAFRRLAEDLHTYFPVTVRFATSSQRVYLVPRTTIAVVLDIVREQFKISAPEIALRWNGKTLDPKKTVGFYKIQMDDRFWIDVIHSEKAS